MIRKFFIPTILISSLLAFPILPEAAADQLIMGVLPRRNAKETIKALTPLAKYLSAKLGRTVKLETSADYDNFWKGVSTLRYDIVHYNQYHYVRSRKRLGYQVIAMNEEFGKATIAGAISIKLGSEVKKIEDLKGKKIVFGGGPKAMMSYILPTYLLRQAGLKKGDYQEDFSKNPPNALMAVYFGQAAAAGVGDTVLELPVVKAMCDTSKLFNLTQSKQVNHLPWAVKQSMPEKLRQQIQAVLINMKNSENGRTVLKKARLTGLLKAKDSDYDEHRQIIKEVLGENY